MSDILLQLLFGASCIGIGFFAGLSLSWREYRRGSRRVAVPTLPRTDRQQAYYLIAVAVLAVASTVFAAIQSAEQQQCNAEFRETLIARSAVSVENQQHLDGMVGVIADESVNPKPDSGAKIRQAVIDYKTWSVEAAERRADNPYADPTCGL